MKHRLEIGDWIVLEPEASRPSSMREFHATFPEQRPLMARVVSDDESTGSELDTSYSYGVQFVFDRRTLFFSYLYALAPWFALVMFIAGIGIVAAWKTSNVYFFWYSPLANLYSILVSTYLISRFALSFLYKASCDRAFRPSVSVVISCKNEEGSIGRTIDCIYSSDYPSDRLDVIVVNDGSTDGTLAEMRRAEMRYPSLTVIDFEKNLGKRRGMAAGARLAKGEILIYVDSDSFVDHDAFSQLVQDFRNPAVGAVCGHAGVANANKNLLTKMQEVRYYAAFRVVKAAESLFGAVACCSGCLAAYRRSFVMEILDEWENQTFLGVPATFGDDRSMTNYMLRQYRVVYNANAVCRTLVPERYVQFFKQQLRWKKSWVRETLIASCFMWKRHPIAAFFFYLGALFPVASPLIVFHALVLPLVTTSTISYLYIYGATLMAALYALYYLGCVRKRLWVYGICFSFLYMFILVWQTYYAVFTVRQNHWGTR